MSLAALQALRARGGVGARAVLRVQCEVARRVRCGARYVCVRAVRWCVLVVVGVWGVSGARLRLLRLC